MRHLYVCINHLYYECTNIVLNGGYLEFELDMIIYNYDEFLEIQNSVYKEEDFEIEYCGVSLIIPVKTMCIFCTKNGEHLNAWVTFNVKTFVVEA